MTHSQQLDLISTRARALEASKIREIAELGMKKDGVIPLWFGEGAWPTSPMIVEAAVASLRAGNHKYQSNSGAMTLRNTLCHYSNDLYGCAHPVERITVTPSGMQGMVLAAQLLISPGDRVVAIEPGWPSVPGAFKLAGAEIAVVSLDTCDGRWVVDIDKLIDALTPQTTAVLLNSPNNPTGWTMTADEQSTVLAHCRKQGIWIIADDVYSRLYRHGRTAPSFLSISEPNDLLISVNSFSKNWSMTGWRLGWINAPAGLEARLGQLTEFNTSSTPGFIQDAGIAALRDGEDEVVDLLARIDAGYHFSATQLGNFERVEFIRPDGAFYCFFRIDGLTDSLTAAKQILHETGIGLAPGIAFGASGEGYLRLCYAQPLDVLAQAFERIAPFLDSKP